MIGRRGRATAKLEQLRQQVIAAHEHEDHAITEHRGAEARVVAAKEALTAAFASAAEDAADEVARREQALQEVEAGYAGGRWKERLEGTRRRILEAEQAVHGYAEEHYDALAADYVAEADEIMAALGDHLRVYATLRSQWRALSGRWGELELLSGGQAARGRLDTPPFPVAITGDPHRRPVPDAIEGGRDVTVKHEGLSEGQLRAFERQALAQAERKQQDSAQPAA